MTGPARPVRDVAARDRAETERWNSRDPVSVVAPRPIDDLDDVQSIERASFTTPGAHAYRTELGRTGSLRRGAGRDSSSAGRLWLMVDEAHITTFAIDRVARRLGNGSPGLLDRDRARAGRRPSGACQPGRAASRSSGSTGRDRPRYYSDDHEDALIMTASASGPPMRERITPPARGLGGARPDGGSRGPGPAAAGAGPSGRAEAGPWSVDRSTA